MADSDSNSKIQPLTPILSPTLSPTQTIAVTLNSVYFRTSLRMINIDIVKPRRQGLRKHNNTNGAVPVFHEQGSLHSLHCRTSFCCTTMEGSQPPQAALPQELQRLSSYLDTKKCSLSNAYKKQTSDGCCMSRDDAPRVAANQGARLSYLVPASVSLWHSSSTCVDFFSHQSKALLTPSISIEPGVAAAAPEAFKQVLPPGGANAEAALSPTRFAI